MQPGAAFLGARVFATYGWRASHVQRVNVQTLVLTAVAVLIAACPQLAAAATLTLAWDPPDTWTPAGYIIFAGTASDRKFRAYDQDTGKVLWEYDLPGAQEGVPAVYQAGGRQYIAVPVGAGSVFQPRAAATNPLPPAGPPQYMVFALPQ